LARPQPNIRWLMFSFSQQNWHWSLPVHPPFQ
jgi:hypothetical protein